MLNQAIRKQLDQLAGLFLEDTLTPGRKAEQSTFLCLLESTKSGMNYHQLGFDSLNADWQKALRDKKRGDIVKCAEGSVKILAIFDIWLPRDTLK